MFGKIGNALTNLAPGCDVFLFCLILDDCSCPGKIIGSTKCNSSDDNCANGITLRPCCVGLHVQCYVLSKQYCLFVGGHWHDDKVYTCTINISMVSVESTWVFLYLPVVIFHQKFSTNCIVLASYSVLTCTLKYSAIFANNSSAS